MTLTEPESGAGVQFEIESLLTEDRRFPPPPAISAGGIASSRLYADAKADRLAFWPTRRARS